MDSQHKDIESLHEMDEVTESVELSIQNAISLVRLEVSVEEAFSEAIAMIEKLSDITRGITGSTAKMIAVMKIKDAINLIEDKLPQIK